MRDDRSPLSSDRDGLMEVGCTLLGLWLLASGVLQGLHWGVYLLLLQAQEYQQPLSAGNMAAIARSLFEVAIALWLLLGYQGIVGAIRRMRIVGVRG